MNLKPTLLLSAALMTILTVQAQSPEETLKNVVIKPATLHFTLDKEQASVKKVTVTNQTEKPIQFRAYLMDWTRDSIGGHRYYTPDTLDISCASWISLDKKFAEVPAGGSRDFNVTLQAPATDEAINKMRWTMLFIESVEEKVSTDNKKGLTSIIHNKMRIGVHIYQTPPSLARKEVQLLRLSKVPDSVNQYKVVCKNTGDIQLQCRAYLELSSLADGKKTTVDGRVFPVFPGQERMMAFKLPADLPKGKYSVVAAVDAGDDVPLEAAQATITVQ